MKNKKAVSPVIATVLLVLIVIILAVIIFLWARGFVSEAVLKEIAGTKDSADSFCSDIKVELIDNGASGFGFKNTGNVPIFKFELKLVDKADGSSEILEIGSDEGGRVNPGFNSIIDNIYEDYEEIELIPTILGKGKGGDTKEFRCPESKAIAL